MRTNSLHEAIRLALMPGLIALAAPLSVSAQAPDQDEVTELDRIEVTGSRIRRSVDFETAQPVLTLTREDIAETGLTSVGDILQKISSNGAALNTTFNNGGNGETRVSLRNLGSNRSLVLVNGRRWVTTLNGAVDLNTIPVAIIERIEVLKDGASAIYGSDAIAGVVNIITRSDYEGAQASAYVGAYDEGDGDTEAYDVTVGARGDRTSAVFNVSYVEQEPVFAGDRPISAVPAFGLPGENVNAGASSTTRQGRFDGPGIPGTIVLDFGNPGCVSGQVCDPSVADQFVTFDPNLHGFNFAPENYLLTPQERKAFFGQGDIDITDNIRFRAQTVFNQRRSAQLLAPVPIVLGSALFGFDGVNDVDISPDSIYNPFGIPITRTQLRSPERFPRVFNQDVDTMYFSGAFEGTLDFADRAFFWDVGYIWGETERLDTISGQLNKARLRDAVGPSFIDANGVPTCGTPDAPIANCVPFNFLGGTAAVTDEMWNSATFLGKDQFGSDFHNYFANISGDLFDLPAGPLSFAAGYEYRRQSAFDSPDSLVALGLTTGNARLPTAGGYSLDEFYGEFNIPLLADAPLAQSLSISLAARYSDYSNFGETTNPKFGIEWRPIEDILVRGTYAEGFRAPSVAELFGGQGDSFPTLADPCSASVVGGFGPDVAARCAADGVPVGTYEQANTQIRITVGGNPNLQPELARTKTLGVVYSPGWLEGLNFSLDWYNIELVQAIGIPTGQFIFNQCYVQGDPNFCALITRGPGGVVVDAFAGVQNLPGGTEVEGWDFNASYSFDTDWGAFQIVWDNAYMSYFGNVGQDPGNNLVGTYQGGALVPLWRIRSNLNVDWELGDWGATVGLRHVSDLDESCFIPVVVADGIGDPSLLGLCSDPGENQDPQFPGFGLNHIGSTTYLDAQLRWTAPWSATIAVGARNLGDKDPPVSYDTFANSFDPQYDVPGRFWYVQYTQNF